MYHCNGTTMCFILGMLQAILSVTVTLQPMYYGVSNCLVHVSFVLQSERMHDHCLPTTAHSFNIAVCSEDLDSLSSCVPVFGYVGGFCAHSVTKTVKCNFCREQLVECETAEIDDADVHSSAASLN